MGIIEYNVVTKNYCEDQVTKSTSNWFWVAAIKFIIALYNARRSDIDFEYLKFERVKLG